MGFLIQAVYSLIAQFPGLAARTHRPCGRMGRRLQAAMGLAGTASMASGALAGTLCARGLIDGTFGYFPATLLGLMAGFLLAGGAVALARAIRNPAPATAENVIPFRRPIEAVFSHAEDIPAPGRHRALTFHKARHYED
jgi:hypothetical protein